MRPPVPPLPDPGRLRRPNPGGVGRRRGGRRDRAGRRRSPPPDLWRPGLPQRSRPRPAGYGSRPRALPGPKRSTAPSRWSTSFGTSGCRSRRRRPPVRGHRRDRRRRVLARLDKGHTAVEAGEAVAVLRAHDIEPRPSFVPFTPLDDARRAGRPPRLGRAPRSRGQRRTDPVHDPPAGARRVAAARRPRPAVSPRLLRRRAAHVDVAFGGARRRRPPAAAGGAGRSRHRRGPSHRRHVPGGRPGRPRRAPATPASRSCPPARSKGGHGSPSRGSAERAPGAGSAPFGTL